MGDLAGHLLRLVHRVVLVRNLSHGRVLAGNLLLHGRDLDLGHGVGAGQNEGESLHGCTSALFGDLALNSDESLVSSDVDHLN